MNGQGLGICIFGRIAGESGHEFVQTPGDSEGQGSLVCCSPCGSKESDMTSTAQLVNLNTI